jgi:hypothetical protein
MALIDGQDLAAVLGLTYADDDDAFDQVASAADAVVTGLLTPRDHTGHPQCVEAALAVGVEIWQARTAAGGQPVALDFTPSTYRLSSYLTKRVSALVSGCTDVRGMVG